MGREAYQPPAPDTTRVNDAAEGWALPVLLQVRTTINACRTKHRSVSPQDGFNYSTTRLMAKVRFRV
jgi:hypothetical protein